MTSALKTTLEVEKANLSATHMVESPLSPLQEGEVRFATEAFALTANNITYAMFGDMMKYWAFFPASEDTRGVIPVWGFATVEESRADGVEPGERVYGYFPMATHLTVVADGIRDGSFLDGSAHRRELADVYNRYVRVASDPAYRADYESAQMLFRPLFMTAFLLDDQLDETLSDEDGPIVLSSASSKTAIGLAWLWKKRGRRVIGLTSPGNRAFTRNLGLYDKVVTYDSNDDDALEGVSAYVDFAGNRNVTKCVHAAAGDTLKVSLIVGATDWTSALQAAADQTATAAEPMPGPEPAFFFAPDRSAKRGDDWGGKVLVDRIAQSLVEFYAPATGWITPVRISGHDDLADSYRKVLSNGQRPSEGLIVDWSR